MPTAIGDDVGACADQVRGYFAHFLGMGDRDRNVYRRLADALGHGTAADRVHALYRDGDVRAAVGAVPLEFVDEVSLLGPVDRVADRMTAYAEAGTTTLALSLFGRSLEAQLGTLRAAARAAERAGLG